MTGWIRSHAVTVGIAGALVLAAGSGFLTSQALGLGAAGAPTETVTVQVGTGATGPAGPPGPVGPVGPAGPAGTGGADQCPTGSTFKAVVINQPGGHIELWVCVAN